MTGGRYSAEVAPNRGAILVGFVFVGLLLVLLFGAGAGIVNTADTGMEVQIQSATSPQKH